MLDSWAQNSKKQYGTHLKKWQTFCQSKGHDPHFPSIQAGSDFLVKLYNEGLGYSSINTARSALSTVVHQIDGFDFGKHPIISRVLAGIFRNRPSLPKYTTTYDPAKVLSFLKTIPTWKISSEGLSTPVNLKLLTLKVTTLLAFASGHRSQSLSFLSLDHMDLKPGLQVVLYIPKMVKNTTPTFHPDPIILPAFREDESLCPVRNIIEYIKATSLKRKSRNLIISFSTFTEVTSDTIRRYITTVLAAAGINIQQFSAGSSRHASNSQKHYNDIPLPLILKSAGWKSDSSFKKHYLKNII